MGYTVKQTTVCVKWWTAGGRRSPAPLTLCVRQEIRGGPELPARLPPHQQSAAWHMHQVAEAAVPVADHAFPTAPASHPAATATASCSAHPHVRMILTGAARWQLGGLSNNFSLSASHTLIAIYRHIAHRSSPSVFLSSSHVTHPKWPSCESRGHLPCPGRIKPTNGSRQSPPLAHCYPESRADRSLPPLTVERS